MRILLVTPLYPPDIVEPALYIKELARRLSQNHTVSILAYGHIPELIPNVKITTVEKSAMLPVRLIYFLCALFKHMHDVDVVYVQNGTSVELPILVTTFFKKMRIILGLNDQSSFVHSQKNFFLKILLTHTIMRASAVIANDSPFVGKEITHIIKKPNIRPEILPFEEFPKNAFERYEDSWKRHIIELTSLFTL